MRVCACVFVCVCVDGNAEYALHTIHFSYSYKIHVFCLESSLHYNWHCIKLQRLFSSTTIFNYDGRLFGVSKMLLLRLTRAIDVNAPHTKWFVLYLAILLTLKISRALSQREDGDRHYFRKNGTLCLNQTKNNAQRKEVSPLRKM